MIADLLVALSAYGSALLGIAVLVFGRLTRRWRLLVLFGLVVQISLFLVVHFSMGLCVEGVHEWYLVYLWRLPINLGGLLKDMGRYGEAEPLYRQALEIGEKTIGKAHPQFAKLLNNLARLLQAMGRYEEADPNFLEALEISIATLGPDHPDTKKMEVNYAAFLKQRGGAGPD